MHSFQQKTFGRLNSACLGLFQHVQIHSQRGRYKLNAASRSESPKLSACQEPINLETDFAGGISISSVTLSLSCRRRLQLKGRKTADNELALTEQSSWAIRCQG